MSFTNYILDCDGVILDSNKFKIEAMRSALYECGYKVSVPKFLEYFKRNFGKSRYHHVKVFFDDYLNRQARAGEAERILECYAKICRSEYENCNLCVGTFEFLDKQSKSDLWVVSGSDQSELRDVFKVRKIDRFFLGILGSPTSKSSNVSEIIKTKGYDKSKTCLIGDSWGDYQAALENNISFIFCKDYSNTSQLAIDYARKGIRVVGNLSEV